MPESFTGTADGMDARAFIQDIVYHQYPGFFHELEEVFNELQDYYHADTNGILKSLAAKIARNADDLYYKEKLVLFPYLEKLQKEKIKFANARPLEKVHYAYLTLLRAFGDMNLELLSLLDCTTDNENLKNLVLKIQKLETGLIRMQMMKENALYSKFRQTAKN